MLPAAEKPIPALTSSEEIFSLAADVALAALDTHQGAHEAQGEKLHQRIFSKNRTLRVREIWVKYSGTHQDRKCSWSSGSWEKNQYSTGTAEFGNREDYFSEVGFLAT
jgi:hypothetical protein